MASRLTEIIIDCHDLEVMADFWCEVLGYERAHSGEGWLAVTAPGQQVTDLDLVTAPQPPAIAFVVVPEDKAVKNRVHLDVAPYERTQREEVDRLIALGAREADIGQQDTRWVVMADPEGNEFCVMPALTD